jgi:hypothetical protein
VRYRCTDLVRKEHDLVLNGECDALKEQAMASNRTTASGERLTLITGMGRTPVSRKAADTYCARTKESTAQKASRRNAS